MLVSDLLAGLIAKLAGLGLASKAALGLTLATAALTSAGAAGVLPEPAQHAVATVVNAVSPLQLPDPTASLSVDTGAGLDDVTGVVSDVAGKVADEVTDDEVTDGDTADDPAEGPKENHGACVSAVAHDHSVVGREHGQAVSAAAKSDCGKAPASTSTSSTSSTSTTTTTTTGDSITAHLDDGANGGRGNSGKGPGNSGQSQNRGSGSGGSPGKSGK